MNEAEKKQYATNYIEYMHHKETIAFKDLKEATQNILPLPTKDGSYDSYNRAMNDTYNLAQNAQKLHECREKLEVSVALLENYREGRYCLYREVYIEETEKTRQVWTESIVEWNKNREWVFSYFDNTFHNHDEIVLETYEEAEHYFLNFPYNI